MWVFDGNGFTMACLAVWIRKRRPAWCLRSDEAVRSGGRDGPHGFDSTLPGSA
jgi:hypothetical protein